MHVMKDILTKVISLLFLTMGFVFPTIALGQNYPEVPNQLPFGGINVKFDQSAKSIIASDIKVLMINQKYWEEKLERALLYFPIIESVFIDEEIPMDFKYLAAQESSLIPEAVSTSNAVGFWQFKEETATELGLRVDRHVDERKNISSSTRAAAEYLKRSNSHFNNWVSSLYSYYQGINGAKEKIPANWSNAYDIALTGKTDRYVLRFFAYKIAFEAGLERYQSKNPVTLVEANAGKGRSLEEISAELKVSSSDLKNYNVWLKGNKIPTDKAYFITVPVANSKLTNVKESLAIVQSDNELASKYEYDDIGFPVLKKSANQPSGYNSHVRYEINGLRGILARGGDYANSLAKAGGLSPSKFRKFNDMDVSMQVVPGEVYYLEPKNKKAAKEFHIVRPGETLQGISHMYGIRLKELLKYNRILSKGYYLETGRELWLTKKRPSNVGIKIHEVSKTREPQPVEPSTQETVAQTPVKEAPSEVVEKTTPSETAPAASENAIPKNASERKRYSPKLADKKEESPAPKPAPTTQPETTASTPTKEEPEKVISRPNSRIVIVADDERPKPYVSKKGTTRPAASTSSTEDVKPVYSPSPSPNAKTPDREPIAVAKREAVSPAASTNATDANRNAAPAYYTVVKGDTYYSVSRKHNLTVTELLELNDMKISDNLQVGKRLRVGSVVSDAAVQTASATPAPATTKAPAAAAKAPVAKPAASTHTVKKGETLFSISQKYKVTVQELTRLNNLKSSGIQPGQKLRIPSK
jgi:membrane-bound lytic murein transglycosylase D